MVGCVYPRGAVGSQPKPWTRLRGSESHWLSSGAPCRTAWGAREQHKPAHMVRQFVDGMWWFCSLPTLWVSSITVWMHYSCLLCILQCTAGLSGTMTSWNVLNSSVVGMSSEPATTRVTLPKIKLIWQNSCIRSWLSSAFFDFCGLNVESLPLWLHALCTIGARFEHAFHRCERCLLLRSTLAELKQFAVLHVSYEIRGPAQFLWWQYGSFSLACEASCAPLLSAPPLGGTRHSDHHDFFARGQSMVTIQPMEGLLDKLIWEDAERGIIRCPGLMYSFGASTLKWICFRARPSCMLECRGT